MILATLLLMTTSADRQWLSPIPLCTIKDKSINESSGIAPSRRQDGVYYTHNDSGDKARFFRFNKSGKLTGTFNLKGADAVDWEDMASALVDGIPTLYFADVGDNFQNRKSIVVYRVKEPETSEKKGARIDAKYELTYPDGAQNCEALFVTKEGSLWFITKSPVGDSKVYTIQKPAVGKRKMNYVGVIKIDTRGFGGKLVTGAAISPDQKFIILRTYSGALEFTVPKNFADWKQDTPRQIKLAIEKQGESICYSRDGKSLITSSEYTPCKVSISLLKQ